MFLERLQKNRFRGESVQRPEREGAPPVHRAFLLDALSKLYVDNIRLF